MSEYRLAVLGDPVEHSRSPQIQNALLALAGLDGTYEKIRADRQILSSTVDGLRRGDWQGLNVTMPLKYAAADLSDRLSLHARRSHSVNTLLFDGSYVWGHSTDSSAFRGLLESERFSSLRTILLLGAGGSAAAALAAIGENCHVYIGARRQRSAETLADKFGGEVIAWGAAVAGALVINSTPLGMKGEDLPDEILAASAGLIDLPYASTMTPAIETARDLGLPWADGHEFLLRQAMDSFRLWTGVDIGYERLSDALRNV